DAGLGLAESSLKDVLELLDEVPLITPEILELTRWAADYYAASWGEMLKASLPAGINTASERILTINDNGIAELNADGRQTSRRDVLRFLSENGETSQKILAKQFGETRTPRTVSELISGGLVDAYFRSVSGSVKPKLRKAVRMLEEGAEGEKPLTELQERIIAVLADNGGEIQFVDLLEKADVGASPIHTLAKRGRVEIFATEVLRDPLAKAALPELTDIKLNAEQQFALDEIQKAVDANGFKTFLLHGITGSGKTEVYIRAMRACLDDGRSALMLVPEIALTPIFSRRLRAIFGDQVAILHSNLSSGERFDEWRRIRAGDARVVIGTRSAIFAPLENIGLIVVDEEHDASYRQHESPFYNARDAAVMRASLAKAVVVLGSATPSLESFENSRAGKYQYLQLQKRIADRPLAQAELIDMREVFRQTGKDVTISPPLIEAIKQT
ncbi:MAG: primosomal protein N', partial [Acidobacteriota bacterium]